MTEQGQRYQCHQSQMWAQVLVSCNRMTHQKRVKNRTSHNRAKVTRVEMAEMEKKKKRNNRMAKAKNMRETIQFRPFQI